MKILQRNRHCGIDVICAVCEKRRMVLLVAPPSNMFEEGLLVPFMSWKHVGAVVDAKNRHLICIFQILKKLHTHIHTHTTFIIYFIPFSITVQVFSHAYRCTYTPKHVTISIYTYSLILDLCTV